VTRKDGAPLALPARPSSQLPPANRRASEIPAPAKSTASGCPAPVFSYSSRPSLVLFGTVGAAPPVAPPCRSGRSTFLGALRQGGRHVLLSTHSPAVLLCKHDVTTPEIRVRPMAPPPTTTIAMRIPCGSRSSSTCTPSVTPREGPEKPASYHASGPPASKHELGKGRVGCILAPGENSAHAPAVGEHL